MNIYRIQLLLLYLGYSPGNPDGIDGPTTRGAVRQFQQDFGGLSVDGLAGEETQKALRHAVAYGFTKRAEEPAHDPQEKPKTGTFWDEIENFDPPEFDCHCGCGTGDPDEELVRKVDKIRKIVGAPITISSGVRCATHNAKVGGVSNSQHLCRRAADLISSAGPQRMKQAAEEVFGNTGGIGVYSWGIHVDTRPTKARWNG